MMTWQQNMSTCTCCCWPVAVKMSIELIMLLVHCIKKNPSQLYPLYYIFSLLLCHKHYFCERGDIFLCIHNFLCKPNIPCVFEKWVYFFALNLYFIYVCYAYIVYVFCFFCAVAIFIISFSWTVSKKSQRVFPF